MSIKVESVTKHYGGFPAVVDLDLACAEGEMLALLGPSGCGKSTTLKMLAGIEMPSAGDIWIKNRKVTALPTNQRNIAMVFEDYALYPHMTAFQNITYPLKVRGYAPDQIADRASKIIDLLDLQDLAAKKVTKLSGGAQQRISIGRALIRDPDLILFDEPLSHLDADQKTQLRSEIKRLQKTIGVTSILVTHDQTEAIAMSDRVAVMNKGVVQQVDDPLVLYHVPANVFVAQFIGEPAMNIIPVELVEEGGRLRLRSAFFYIALTDGAAGLLRASTVEKKLLLGVRPEHLRLAAEDAADAFALEVGNREPRGDTHVLTLHADRGQGATRIQLEAPSSGRYAPGATCRVRIPEGAMHFFSAVSGKNIRYRA